MATKTQKSSFTVERIEQAAVKMLYESTFMDKLCTPVGRGAKGSVFQYRYFDPSTFATGASTLVEVDDFVNYTQLTNASRLIYASELGIITFLTDTATESTDTDPRSEIGRQQGISVATKLEKHILGVCNTGMVTGTVTATNSTNGLTFTSIAGIMSTLRDNLLTVPGHLNLVLNEFAWWYTAKSTYATTYGAAMPKLGDAVLDKWYISTLFGDVDVFRTNNITASSTGTAFMFAKEALALWTPRPYRLREERDESARGTEFISTMRAGAKVVQPSFTARISVYGKQPTTF